MGCYIPDGALFYGEPRRRTPVAFTGALRQTVRDSVTEMHSLYSRSYTPQVKQTKACGACSLKEACLPGLTRRGTVSHYLRQAMEDTP